MDNEMWVYSWRESSRGSSSSKHNVDGFVQDSHYSLTAVFWSQPQRRLDCTGLEIVTEEKEKQVSKRSMCHERN